VTAPATSRGTAVRGVGIDAVEVDRLRQALARRPSLAERLFTDDERAYAARASDPGPHLAARFAAKEALSKALGVGIGAVSWRDVEVVRDDSGAPSLLLAGEAARLAARAGIGSWHLSLTHTDALAMAVVIGEVATGEAPQDVRPGAVGDTDDAEPQP
jgi:holo-[acyl-carrier protein] synthase